MGKEPERQLVRLDMNVALKIVKGLCELAILLIDGAGISGFKALVVRSQTTAITIQKVEPNRIIPATAMPPEPKEP